MIVDYWYIILLLIAAITWECLINKT